ncbi:hypothetical protein [Clostridium sardiniense]|uniref:hypothetical protein n=1 Tax=Clostridium sardiniense TaxID=29369 RepID=UPI003D35976E
MGLNKKYMIFNVIKFLVFLTIVIASFGYNEMYFGDITVKANLREAYIIFSVVIAFLFGNLFLKFFIKNKLLTFIASILFLVIITKYWIAFIGMTLCIISMDLLFESSIRYFIDFFIKETKLVYIVFSLLNFFSLLFICEILSMEPLL